MKYIYFFLIATTALVSCKKDEAELYTQSASNAALAEKFTIDVIKEILSKGPDYVISQAYTGTDGLIVSSDPLIDTEIFPKEITFNYGSGITGPLGIKRAGSLVFTIQSGTVKTNDIHVSFDNFSVNESRIIGEIDFNYNAEKIGYNGEYVAAGISIVNGNGTMKMDGTFSLERLSTSGTITIDDDLYNFTCATTGVDFLRTSFSYISQIDHTINLSCPDYITSGTSTVTPNDKGNQTLDFGGENCDANAVLKGQEGTNKNVSF